MIRHTKRAFIHYSLSKRFQGLGLWIDCNAPEIKPVLFVLHVDLLFFRFYMVYYKR